MRFWIGVTDNGWFDYLSRANVDEVNFSNFRPAIWQLLVGRLALQAQRQLRCHVLTPSPFPLRSL